jgi:hypothetical protein
MPSPPSPTERNPLIFIPGITGSELGPSTQFEFGTINNNYC